MAKTDISHSIVMHAYASAMLGRTSDAASNIREVRRIRPPYSLTNQLRFVCDCDSSMIFDKANGVRGWMTNQVCNHGEKMAT